MMCVIGEKRRQALSTVAWTERGSVLTCDQSRAIVVPSPGQNGSFVGFHALLDSSAFGSQMEFPCRAARGRRVVSLSHEAVGVQERDVVMQPAPQRGGRLITFF